MTENLILQILEFSNFIIFCSWPSRILNLAFYKNSNFDFKIFDFGHFGLSDFGFGILEYSHFTSIRVI